MLKWRAPLWMYVVAAVYVLTFFFNARQEAWGPANPGWVPSWPTLKVAGVVPGKPMDNAGLRAGDVLEAVDGQPLNGVPDWFLARAHFEREHALELQIRRGEQYLRLQFVKHRFLPAPSNNKQDPSPEGPPSIPQAAAASFAQPQQRCGRPRDEPQIFGSRRTVSFR